MKRYPGDQLKSNYDYFIFIISYKNRHKIINLILPYYKTYWIHILFIKLIILKFSCHFQNPHYANKKEGIWLKLSKTLWNKNFNSMSAWLYYFLILLCIIMLTLKYLDFKLRYSTWLNKRRMLINPNYTSTSLNQT